MNNPSDITCNIHFILGENGIERINLTVARSEQRKGSTRSPFDLPLHVAFLLLWPRVESVPALFVHQIFVFTLDIQDDDSTANEDG